MSETIVNPMNEAAFAAQPAAPRLAALAGKTVALLDISKPGGDVFLNRIEALLLDRHQVARVIRERKPTFAKPAPASIMDRLRAAKPDAVIEGLAD
jgi:hypothetical protein